MPIRTIFLGSPAFAVPSLTALADADDIEVALVVTQPDRPAGRGRTLSAPPVKLAASELGLPAFQPDGLRDESTVEQLRQLGPDLLVVVAYGELLRRAVLDLAPRGAINVHPSLLPRYRGASPIPAAILAGDRETGVSIIKLVRRLDAGPILAQVELDITDDDTSGTLGERLASLAGELLPGVVRDWTTGSIVPRDQDESLATMTREWSRQDARIDWYDPATYIERLIRAASPWPVAWTTLNGAALAIRAARLATQPVPVATAGVVRFVAGSPVVSTGSGVLELLQVQPPGKRAMPAADWWRGLRVSELALGT